jgi:hypothetical protein
MNCANDMTFELSTANSWSATGVNSTLPCTVQRVAQITWSIMLKS